MTKPRQSSVLPLSLLLASYTLTAVAGSQDYPEISDDGLHLVKESKMAVVYAEPGADLGVYKRIKLVAPEIAFKKNWERDLRSGSASKISRVNTKKIKSDLAEMFAAVFYDTLTEGGYELVAEDGEDVLLIRPSIINLDITAPEQHGTGRSNSYTRSAGEMTLYIELHDSETGDLIAKALDRSIDNPNQQGFYTWANASTNQRAAERILKGWADLLLNALNEAKQSAPIALPESE